MVIPLPPINVGAIVLDIVEGIVSNQLTKQNILDKVKHLDDTVNHEFYKRDRVIVIFEEKIKELEGKLLEFANKKIDETEKKIEGQTPFFVHGAERKAAETVKEELKKVADQAVEVIDKEVEALEGKLKEEVPFLNTLIPTDSSTPSTPLVEPTPETFHDDVDKSQVVEEVKHEVKDFLSEGAQEALKELKDKFGDNKGS